VERLHPSATGDIYKAVFIELCSPTGRTHIVSSGEYRSGGDFEWRWSQWGLHGRWIPFAESQHGEEGWHARSSLWHLVRLARTHPDEAMQKVKADIDETHVLEEIEAMYIFFANNDKGPMRERLRGWIVRHALAQQRIDYPEWADTFTGCTVEGFELDGDNIKFRLSGKGFDIFLTVDGHYSTHFSVQRR